MDFLFRDEEEELKQPDRSLSHTPDPVIKERILQSRMGTDPDEGALDYAKSNSLTAGLGRGIAELSRGAGFNANTSQFDAMEKRGQQAVSDSVKNAILAKQQKQKDEELAYKRDFDERKLASDERMNREKLNKTDQLLGMGKMLPADKVLLVDEGNQMPKLMSNIRETISGNKDIFGPIRGNIGSINPYDDRAQAIQSQMRSYAQLVGKYMEGGVLRKEDEEKYRKMLPQLGDTPQTAENKLAIVENMLADKQASSIAALQASGYNSSGVNSGSSEIPDLPSILSGRGSNSGMIQEAQAGSGLVKVSNGDETVWIPLEDLPDAMKDKYRRVK